MEKEKEYLQSRQFILIPTTPILDFGTIEPGEKVASKSFVVDMIVDKEGVIDCAVDWINVEPKKFRKGRAPVTVQLVTARLRRGEQHQARIKFQVGEESETVKVKARVRRYSEKEIAEMEAKLAALEQQLQAESQARQQLEQQVKASQVRQYNKKEIAEMEARIAALEQQLRAESQARQQLEQQAKGLQEQLTSVKQPILKVAPTNIDFGKVWTQNLKLNPNLFDEPRTKASTTIEVLNIGQGHLKGFVTASEDWLEVTPSQFNELHKTAVRVSAKAEQLSMGINRAKLFVQTNGG